MTSHAAVVARGMGKTCVVGAGEITVDAGAHGELRARRPRRRRRATGSRSTARRARSSSGKLPTQPSEVLQVLIDGTLPPEKSPLFATPSRGSWSGPTRARRLGVRANADTPDDARVARLFGAEGIGLCRTEHMFFEENRIVGGARDDPGRDGRGPARGAREDPPDAARGLRRDLPRDGGAAGHDPAARSAAPRVPAARGRRRSQQTAAELGGPRREAPRARPRARTRRTRCSATAAAGSGSRTPRSTRCRCARSSRPRRRRVREGLRPSPEIMIPLVGTKGEFDTPEGPRRRDRPAA